MIGTLFLLLIVYQLKHFLADYPLQNEYMLKKFSPEPKVWIPALALHAGVHAWFTLVIGYAYIVATRGFPAGGQAATLVWAVGALDFAVHFTMDRIKASPRMLGRFKALSANEWAVWSHEARSHNFRVEWFERVKRDNTYFWWSLGLDQMVHHLTHYTIIFLLLMS